VLTFVDVASDKPPAGACGHRVILTRRAAEAALPDLLGMGVNYKPGWDGHDPQRKFGIITSAELVSNALRVSGYMFARDFPELEATLNGSSEERSYGMSYELEDAHVADMRASVWTLTRVTFMGASVLLKQKAAYRATSFYAIRSIAR
jgi:hypothetical protein